MPPPEVCGHQGNIQGSGYEGGRQALQKAKQDSLSRQVAWVKRKHCAGGFTGFRPVKRYRVSAKKFLVNLDNQARRSCIL